MTNPYVVSVYLEGHQGVRAYRVRSSSSVKTEGGALRIETGNDTKIIPLHRIAEVDIVFRDTESGS